MKARVFVSSAIAEFGPERKIAKRLDKFYPFLAMWVFEEEGATSASLEQSYRGPLEKSDLVIFLLGSDITSPVLAEVELTIRHNKRTLLILKDVPHRSEALHDAIAKLDVKYASYPDVDAFEQILRNAIEAELVAALQSPPQRSSSDPKYRALRSALAQSAELRIEPFVGPNSDNRFGIAELSASEITVRKISSSHLIVIPIESIRALIPDGRDLTVALSGRIQWITTQQVYKLLPSDPKDDIGMPKAGSPGSTDAVVLQGKLEKRGYYSQWNRLAEVNADRYEVAYDDDGRYFRCEGRMPGWVEVLVARK